MKSTFRTTAAVLVLLLAAAPAVHAKEAYADFAMSVADAEFVVIAAVKEIGKDKTVVLTVTRWLKGKATENGELSLKGRSGFCVIDHDVSEIMKPGERYALFVFPGGKPGRLGHIQLLNEDGTFAQPESIFMNFPGNEKPKNVDAFAKLVEAELKKPAEKSEKAEEKK